ncbi:hypothetical protein HII36_20920 [Nonomuraea sp. NN258]|uniref:hypothetical protein n=1 Tax=Nonomuraea antri TaxID=2730852 RepID=UPI00156879C3|nr:hypothetical protein [Nonomuraea antri]NRQ34296.1 hypothetical protein [Nonomuraea antri]
MKGMRRLEAAAQGAKVWPSPLQALLVAERCALLAQHDDVFLQMITKSWTGSRWSELLALQPNKLLRKQQLLDINQEVYELKGSARASCGRRLTAPTRLGPGSSPGRHCRY